MDAQLFRLPTEPQYYKGGSLNQGEVENQISKPAQSLNARYPGSVAIAADGNVFTDYRPKCTKNVPTGQQYATRQWLQHNAEDIIKVSRERQAKATGASYMNASTVPPPVAIAKCDIDKCGYYPSNANSSVQIPTGIERGDIAPPLFGTFEFGYQYPTANVTAGITRLYEGGRNTPRGSSKA